MSTDSFQLNLPKEFLPVVNQLEGDDLEDKVRISLAIGLYGEKQVLLSRAAELGISPNLLLHSLLLYLQHFLFHRFFLMTA